MMPVQLGIGRRTFSHAYFLSPSQLMSNFAITDWMKDNARICLTVMSRGSIQFDSVTHVKGVSGLQAMHLEPKGHPASDESCLLLDS